MFKTNLKIAWRNLIKDRQFTLLNVLGLAAGLACSVFIYLWVSDEMSYDKFFKNDSQLYQLMERRTGDGDAKVSDESSGIVTDIVKVQYPEVAYAASVAPPEWFQQFTLSAGDKNIKALGQYAGKDYFNVFSFILLEGEAGKVLQDKNSIVISDELAKKLFGTTTNIIGQAVKFQHDTTFFVSGVFEKLPYHSSVQFDFVLSFDYYASVQPWVKQWGNTGPHNFVLLKKETNLNEFNNRMGKLALSNFYDSTRTVYAARFSDNYLLNSFDHGVKVGGKIEYVRLFSLIAVFILIIACINFMNLSTAKTARRMKEVGIKKVVGADRTQLIFQFLSEAVLLSFCAMFFAMIIVWALLPQFNHMTGKEISLKFTPEIVFAVVSIALVTGLLAGSYPAFYLSKFNPISILKSKLNNSFAEMISRKGLVVFQFTLSAIMIIAVIIIYQQIKFIQSTDPGYNKDNIVRLGSEGALQGKEENFIAELKKIPGVINGSFTFNNMVGRNFGNYNISWEGKDPNTPVYFEGFGAGYDFIETMGMHMAAGRSFSREYGDEVSKILLNEAAIRVMHLTDPVGKTITYGNGKRQIIGVVKDFHFESLHETVKPAFFTLQLPEVNPWYKMMVRIKGQNQQQTIAAIQKTYEAYNPGFPFAFNFLDEAYQKQYDTETRVSDLSKYFAALAIIISCLGLFGLTAFTAQKRQKEIGIRKIVGASSGDITILLSKDFFTLIVIALMISFPLSWWLMSNWLQSFAYRININAWVFVMAGISIVLITLLTIGFQSIKAATANPVKSLRTE